MSTRCDECDPSFGCFDGSVPCCREPLPMPPGVTMPPRCVHNAHPDMCPFCKADRELEEHPELAVVKQRPHEFGCPLFVNEAWIPVERSNYERIYGGDGKCNCKKE